MNHQDNHITLYNKSCLDMSELADESIQCVVTSPPYFGLRKYSGEQDFIWPSASLSLKSGDKDCQHEWATNNKKVGRNDTEEMYAHAEKLEIVDVVTNTCFLCGAWRGAYGLEPTPEMYVQHTVEIMREIRRVLRKDGVVFWNIGDSYNGSGGDHKPGGKNDAGFQGELYRGVQPKRVKTLKPKDLCLIPFRVAIALQEDGWWIRSDIIWNKPNPMPESVTDRPTNSHEYIFQLTKSGKPLYWTHRDGKATSEKPKADYRWVNQLTEEESSDEPADWKEKIACSECEGGIVNVHLGLDVWQKQTCPVCKGKKEIQKWKRYNLWKGHDYYWDMEAVREAYTEPMNRWGGEKLVANGNSIWDEGTGQSTYRDRDMRPNPAGRNLRSVWEFPTQPYAEAHFATFPEKLPETCILAATPEVGCCSKCGKPWVRMVEVSGGTIGESWHDHSDDIGKGTSQSKNGIPLKTFMTQKMKENPYRRESKGWQPQCKCNAEKVPSLVLDPFAGAGTTLWVAKKLNRRAVGYEISEEYCDLIIKRNRQQVML